MICTVIEVLDHTVAVEFEHPIWGLIRRYISRSIIDTSVKNVQLEIPQHTLLLGIEYSDVDLVTGLGLYGIPDIQALAVEQAMHKAGLWKREDYRRKPVLVAKVLTQFPGIDPTLVLNAASRSE